MEFKLPSGMSHSAMSSYAECGERFRLERIYRLPTKPNWATIGGSVVHSITEVLDLNELGAEEQVPDFEEALDAQAAKEAARAEIDVSDIRHTGRASKAWPNKHGRDWWLENGSQFVDAWVEWRDGNDYELLIMPDGMPAVEVSIQQELLGRIFRGFIDRIYVDRKTGELIVVDLKTGKKPSSHLQLGSYRLGMLRKYGMDIRSGAYWVASDGSLTEPFDLSVFTEEYVENLYRMTWSGIEAGVFMPSPGMFCSSCGVADFCRAKGTGLMINEIPVRDVAAGGQDSA